MSSLASRFARKLRRAISPKRGRSIDLRLDLTTGQVVCSSTGVNYKTRARYLADHYSLPEGGGGSVVDETLLAMIGTAEKTGTSLDWRRALIHLAHHRSELASRLLVELEPRVPPKLHDYWELAYAEAVGWLGSEYYRDDEGVAHVVPAGTVFSKEKKPLN